MSDRQSDPDSQGVEASDPPIPEFAYNIVNPVVSLLLRSRFHWLVSDSLLLITFTGRKSGDSYRTPVGYQEQDGTLYVSTHSPWWQNLKGGQPVTLRLRGEQRQAVAEPVTDPEWVAAYMDSYIEAHGMEHAQRLGIAIDGEGRPSRAALEDGLGGDLVVLKITLEADQTS